MKHDSLAPRDTIAYAAGGPAVLRTPRRRPSDDMMLPADSLPSRAPDLEIREVPDGYVVYDPATDRLHFLNGSAAFVLQCCDGATRADELPELLAAAFRLDADPVAEVEACLARLLSEALVTTGPPRVP